MSVEKNPCLKMLKKTFNPCLKMLNTKNSIQLSRINDIHDFFFPWKALSWAQKEGHDDKSLSTFHPAEWTLPWLCRPYSLPLFSSSFFCSQWNICRVPPWLSRKYIAEILSLHCPKRELWDGVHHRFIDQPKLGPYRPRYWVILGLFPVQ